MATLHGPGWIRLAESNRDACFFDDWMSGPCPGGTFLPYAAAREDVPCQTVATSGIAGFPVLLCGTNCGFLVAVHLFIQIPCLNEAETLPAVLSQLPGSIPGIHDISVLIIDDGSTDGTSQVALQQGAHHVVRFPRNRGLAYGFMAGLDACVRLGADIVVNTDGDGQYNADDIATLVAPILAGEAEVVVGDRQVRTISSFSSTKKALQVLGSWVVRQFSDTPVADTTSGFRAYSRDAAMRAFVSNDFTYTLETLIQAGARRMAVTSVPIRTNPKTRESRLFRSIGQYVRRSAGTILRAYTLYQPLKVFLSAALLCFVVGVAIGVRFLYYYFLSAQGAGHIQSLILGAVFFVASFTLMVIGVVCDLVATNRRLLEDLRYRLIRLESGGATARLPAGGPESARPLSSATATIQEPAVPLADGGA